MLSLRDTCELLSPFLVQDGRERFAVVFFGPLFKLLSQPFVLTEGEHDRAFVSARQLFGLALSCNASAMVIAHNHPSGIIKPSREDVRITKVLKELGSALEVKLLDHLILGGTEVNGRRCFQSVFEFLER